MDGISTELLVTLLNISDIEIESFFIDNHGSLIIRVNSTKVGAICHKCGCDINKPYGFGQEVTLRHLPVFGRKVYLILKPPRYKCTNCTGKSTTTQQLSWYTRKSTSTKLYEEHILLSLINSTIKDVSIKENFSYYSIESILDRNIHYKIDWMSISELNIVGIDEISLKKGHKDFVVIISVYIEGALRLIGVLENREKSTVKKFFLSIPSKLRKTVKVVCSDLYIGFINAAKEVFGKKVKVVADRFHVAKLYRSGLDELRKKEMRRLKNELLKEDYDKLKNVMWLLRRKFIDLSPAQQDTLNLLFVYSPDLRLAYDLSYNLTSIFDSQILKGEAKRKIKGWMRRVKNSNLTCFNKFLKTLDSYMEEISNYFYDKNSSGFVEGLNNKIKVLKRRCYGLTNIKHLFQRVRLDLEGYSLFSCHINELQ